MKLQTDEEINKAIFSERNNSSMIASLWDYVENITIEIVDAYNKEEVGKRWNYLPSDKAFFYHECSFSECYGIHKGLRFNEELRRAINEGKEHFTAKISCGGKGDIGLQYSCDNYIVIEVLIQYSSQYRQ